jgi:hypothetical protein
VIQATEVADDNFGVVPPSKMAIFLYHEFSHGCTMIYMTIIEITLML